MFQSMVFESDLAQLLKDATLEFTFFPRPNSLLVWFFLSQRKAHKICSKHRAGLNCALPITASGECSVKSPGAILKMLQLAFKGIPPLMIPTLWSPRAYS